MNKTFDFLCPLLPPVLRDWSKSIKWVGRSRKEVGHQFLSPWTLQFFRKCLRPSAALVISKTKQLLQDGPFQCHVSLLLFTMKLPF